MLPVLYPQNDKDLHFSPNHSSYYYFFISLQCIGLPLSLKGGD